MKKPIQANIESKMTQKLISLLTDLEGVEYTRMSSDGKYYLDEIWKLLRMPTNQEMQKALEDKEKLKKNNE